MTNKLRKFGVTLGFVLELLGLILLWREKPIAPHFIILGGILLGLALLAPRLLAPIEKHWMKLAEILGWIMTRVLLLIIFYLVLTPVSLIAKLVGHEFLDLKWPKSEPSYWHYREKKLASSPAK